MKLGLSKSRFVFILQKRHKTRLKITTRSEKLDCYWKLWFVRILDKNIENEIKKIMFPVVFGIVYGLYPSKIASRARFKAGKP